ncbi:class I SAM-dependent methyltransferase [Microbulbifer discodermiae]|uniref:class I SAM-dependent methyltransferase n=1 Tax=Microbulbifer sp. 2201CG32-9 TaxID=3232309 RepID=UPI00345C4C13
MNKSKLHESAEQQRRNAWDTYWEGTKQASTYKGGETESHILMQKWNVIFTSIANQHTHMLDIASGYGILASLAYKSLEPRNTSITCVDISKSALEAIEKKVPHVNTKVCDAAQLPFDDASFTLITSQFGIEYAGLNAFREAGRVLQPGGLIAFVSHLTDGGIHKECNANRAAVEDFIGTDFLNLTHNLLETKMTPGFSQLDIKTRMECLKPAIEATVDIVKKYGRNVAGGSIDKVFMDAAKISRSSENFDKAEVLSWLRKMESELIAYSERMRSMCEASLDQTDIQHIKNILLENNIHVNTVEKLPFVEGGENCAWLITAQRGSTG